MKTYSTKLTDAQNVAFNRFENVTGFDPIHVEDFEEGRITAKQLWSYNLGFIEDLHATVTHIRFPVD